MKVLEKINLINSIGRELQSRMTFSEIDNYFQAYGIPTDHNPSYNSKYVYVKEILPKIDEEIIIQIANELNIEHNYQTNLPLFKDISTNYWKTGHFKLFISHITSFKKTVAHLKTALEKYGISSFVAHEDIEPTKEWQDELEKGLFTMDALCAILMPGFKESNWTDQEVGIAIGRGVLVIPVRKEIDPYGFIGKYQGYQSLGQNIEEVAEGIFNIIVKNPKSRNKIISCLVDLFLLSNKKVEALERLNAIIKISEFPLDRIVQMKSKFTENENLKDKEIIKKFNEFIFTFNIGGVELHDFKKNKQNEDDGLPF
jgi:hypothetical protein